MRKSRNSSWAIRLGNVMFGDQYKVINTKRKSNCCKWRSNICSPLKIKIEWHILLNVVTHWFLLWHIYATDNCVTVGQVNDFVSKPLPKQMIPDSKVHGAPCWPHELCYLGWFMIMNTSLKSIQFRSDLGVTKAPFVNFFVREFLSLQTTY